MKIKGKKGAGSTPRPAKLTNKQRRRRAKTQKSSSVAHSTSASDLQAVVKEKPAKAKMSRAERRAAIRAATKKAKKQAVANAAIDAAIKSADFSSPILHGRGALRPVPAVLGDWLERAADLANGASWHYNEEDRLAQDSAGVRKDNAYRRLRVLRTKSREGREALKRGDYVRAIGAYEFIHHQLEPFQPGLARERLFSTAILSELHRLISGREDLLLTMYRQNEGTTRKLGSEEMLAQKVFYLVQSLVYSTTARVMIMGEVVERGIDLPRDDDAEYRAVADLMDPLYEQRTAVKEALNKLDGEKGEVAVGYYVKSALEQFFGDADAVMDKPSGLPEFVRNQVMGDMADRFSPDGHWILQQKLGFVSAFENMAFTLASNIIQRVTGDQVSVSPSDAESGVELMRRLQSTLVRGFGTSEALATTYRLYTSHLYVAARNAEGMGDWTANEVASGRVYKTGKKFTSADVIPSYERAHRLLGFILSTMPDHKEILEDRARVAGKIVEHEGAAPSESLNVRASSEQPGAYEPLFEKIGERLVPPSNIRGITSDEPSPEAVDLGSSMVRHMPSLAQSLLFHSGAAAISSFASDEGPLSIPRGLYQLTDTGLPSRGDVMRLIHASGLSESMDASAIWNLWIDAAKDNLSIMDGISLDPAIGTFHGLSAMMMLRRFMCYVADVEISDVSANNIMRDVMYDTVACGMAMGLHPVEVWEVGYAMPELSLGSIGSYEIGDFEKAIARLRDDLGNDVYPALAAFAGNRNDALAHLIFTARAGMVHARSGDASEALPLFVQAHMGLQRVKRERDDVPWNLMKPLIGSVNDMRQSFVEGGAVVQRDGEVVRSVASPTPQPMPALSFRTPIG